MLLFLISIFMVGGGLLILEKLTKTLITPSHLLSIPYILSSLTLLYLDTINYTFRQPYYEFISINNIMLLIFIMIEFFLRLIFRRNNHQLQHSIKHYNRNQITSLNRKLTIPLIIITISIAAYSLYNIEFITDKISGGALLNTGLIGHMIIIATFISILLFPHAFIEKKYLHLLIILFTLLSVKFLIGTKYAIYSYTSSLIITYAIFNKLKTINLLIFMGIGILLFYITYSISFLLSGNNLDSEAVAFFNGHILTYVSSSVYNSGFILSNEISSPHSGTIFTAFENIYLFIVQSETPYISGISDEFIQFSESEYSNVFGVFGDVYFKEKSFIILVIFTIGLSTFSSLLSIMASISESLAIKTLNIINLSFLLISFFSYWHDQLMYIEYFAFSILLFLFERQHRKRNII